MYLKQMAKNELLAYTRIQGLPFKVSLSAYLLLLESFTIISWTKPFLILNLNYSTLINKKLHIVTLLGYTIQVMVVPKNIYLFW